MPRPLPRVALPIVAAIVAAFAFAVSCSSDGSGPRGAPAAGPLETWHEVYTFDPSQTVRRPVLRGFVGHRVNPGSSESIHLVEDLEHRQRGFVLEGGKAFRFVRDESGTEIATEVAHAGLDRGILAILGVEGSVEYRPITAPSGR